MKIIQTAPNPGGAYPAIQEAELTAPPEGTAIWPEELPTGEFYDHNGFVKVTFGETELTVEGKTEKVPVVVSYEPDVDAWNEWKLSGQETEYEAPPTPMEQMRADIDYLAAMAGVAL